MMASTEDSKDLAVRNQKKEKQLRYQRHKARLASPNNGGSTKEGTPDAVNVTENLAVPSLASPSRKNAFSSPYIQNKLSTPPRKKEEPPPEESPTATFPIKRQQPGPSVPGTRKSDLVRKMKAKKREDKGKCPQPQQGPEEKEEQEEMEQTSVAFASENEKESSEPGTATTVDSDGEDPSSLLQACGSQDSAEPPTSSPVKQLSPQKSLDKMSDHEDPPLGDIHSEAAGAPLGTPAARSPGAFDMRSIMEHPPTPPPEPEADILSSNDPFEGLDTNTDVSIFDPVDDAFAQELQRLEDSQQEEKKEKETGDENPPTDMTWDTTNPVFQQSLLPAKNTQCHGAVDMFDNSSWDEASATFPEVESQFLQLMEEATAEGASMNLSVEEMQVLEDVKRNLELASSLDQADSSGSPEKAKYSSPIKSSPSKRLETPKEDEPLKFGQGTIDETSLPEAVSRSGSHGAAVEASGEPADEETAATEPLKEDEPLLLGVSSSDDTEVADSEDVIPVDQRVEMYNAPKETDEESSVEEEAADEDWAKEDDNENEAIGYISQDSEEEEEATVDLLNPLDNTAHKLSREFPTFDAAAVAAMKSLAPTIEVDGLSAFDGSSLTDTASIATSTAVGCMQRLAAMAPPPPPPAGGKRKKKRSKTTKNKGGAIPLIAPIPEEKLKKWEEAKTRGLTHLASMKAKLLDSFDGFKSESSVGVTGTSEPSLFASSTTKPAKTTRNEKAQLPVNIGNVAGDTKLAEKVASASLAAALSFDERLASPGPVSPATSHAKPSTENPVVGGAFQNWTESDFKQARLSPTKCEEPSMEDDVDQKVLLTWLTREVFGNDQIQTEQSNIPFVLRLLLEDDDNFNKMCQYLADSVNNSTVKLAETDTFDEWTLASTETRDDSISAKGSMTSRTQELEKARPILKPVLLSHDSQKLASGLLAANFVSFLYLASKLTKVSSPFGSTNPFLAAMVTLSLHGAGVKLNRGSKGSPSLQQLIFDHPLGRAELVVKFAYMVCHPSVEKPTPETIPEAPSTPRAALKLVTYKDAIVVDPTDPVTPNAANLSKARRSPRFTIPTGSPSPFETALWETPRIIPAVLSFLGDPVAVCRVKMVNRYCHRLVSENEHQLMQDAARVGGLSMNIRPAFWLWIALDKCEPDVTSRASRVSTAEELQDLAEEGKEGKWSHVIERDVERSFGTLPPHKTGARLRTDSIVQALVFWGKNRLMKRGVKGGGDETPLPELGPSKKPKDKPVRSSASPPPWECSPGREDDDETSETPTDTVSDWGGVSPVASMTETSTVGFIDGENEGSGRYTVVPREELALSGNCLTPVMKTNLQNKLRFILHTLAASHGSVGYCQGMDYVVAHLLRILQDTIRWNAVQNTLPSCIVSTSTLPDLSSMKDEPLLAIYDEIDKSLVVEEAIFRVMDTFFTSYNLRHMYWPELRCLKTCCRVFERLIQIKLPVLADHFEHHDLNVGLFALGWFQTLFLYLPSMPSATVCHMWDIWLVERSFKIFFRVGTAILFLSQPILLNHELEGMMTYLNTIPDATLLKADILIPCALNIKVTTRMLQELEAEVAATEV